MAVISGTDLSQPQFANGYLTCDGVLGARSQTDINNQRLSTQPVLTPNGITSTGLATFTGGATYGGAQKDVLITVAAAGATQGTATAIPATANLVNVTVTASTEGVALPACSTGRTIVLLTPTTKGYKVYSNAAGTVINAATTATTAFAMTTLHPCTFVGVDTTHWRAYRGN